MSDLKSVSAGVQVPAATPADYIVQATLPPPTTGWAIERDWNDGVLGTVAEGPDGWDSEAGWSTYNAAQAHSGSQSCLCLLKANIPVSTFLWGGRVSFPSPIVEGEVMYHEVWLRAPAFENFSFPQDPYMPSGAAKFLRYEHDVSFAKIIQLRSTDLSNDFSTTRSGLSDLTFGPNGTFKWEVWQKYQIEVGIGGVSKDEGGNGYMKMWVDDVNILDETNFRTISTPTSNSWIMHRFMNTWSPNEPLPYDIWIWVDDLKIYNRRPTWWPA